VTVSFSFGVTQSVRVVFFLLFSVSHADVTVHSFCRLGSSGPGSAGPGAIIIDVAFLRRFVGP
jgi:hypothetical protein